MKGLGESRSQFSLVVNLEKSLEFSLVILVGIVRDP